MRTLPPLVKNQRPSIPDELYEIQTILAKHQGNEQAKLRWDMNLMLMLKQRKLDQRKRSEAFFLKGRPIFGINCRMNEVTAKERNEMLSKMAFAHRNSALKDRLIYLPTETIPPCHLWLLSFPL